MRDLILICAIPKELLLLQIEMKMQSNFKSFFFLNEQIPTNLFRKRLLKQQNHNEIQLLQPIIGTNFSLNRYYPEIISNFEHQNNQSISYCHVMKICTVSFFDLYG